MRPSLAFATVDPFHGMNADQPGEARNLLGGAWLEAAPARPDLPDPLTGGDFLRLHDTEDTAPFVERLLA